LIWLAEGNAHNIALAIWRGEEYIFNFLSAIQLRFRQTNNAKQQNKQRAFVSLISCGTGQTEHSMPPLRQAAYRYVRFPTTQKFAK
jgi:hypothetical protein